ncbi:MAG: glycosyltransferase [Planctomycetaceae bacterium]|nr:glycosyltransferase [Planctomycetaceae bacterium]
MPAGPLKVGYVVKRYPRFSETFVVNEILAHEAAGLPLEVFSLRPPVDTHFQDALSRVRSPLTYLSCGRVKANELWEAMNCCADVFPDTFSVLQHFTREDVLDIYCGLRLAVEAERRRVTHLHAHFASGAATVARIASRLAGIPFSVTAHAKDIFHESVRAEDLAGKLHDASATVTVSDFNLQYLRRAFPHCGDSIVRIYNGIHLHDFPFRLPDRRPPRIAAVGRFVEKKGFADLIDACAELRDRQIRFECVLAGSGELEQELAGQIQRLRLADCVKMAGPCPQRDIKRLLQSSAVMAAPCVSGSDGNRDGLPTVLLEAMALGTPCVSTDVTGIPEVVRHDATGLMVPQHNPRLLAEALHMLLFNVDLRIRLAKEARAMIEEEFDAVRNTEQQRALFSSVAVRHADRTDCFRYSDFSGSVPAESSGEVVAAGPVMTEG